MKVLSLTVHESEPTLLDQCMNYVTVGGVDRIVVHVNRTSRFDVAAFERMRQEIAPLRERVIINPLSLAIRTMRENPELSQGVHLAHIQNFLFARELYDIEHFMLDASNCLLVREGLCGALDGPFRLSFSDIAKWSHRREYARDVGMDERFGRISSHEGTCFRVDVFEKMLPILMRYEARSEKIGFDYAVQYPREEAHFTNALLEAGWAPAIAPPYIDMPWHRNLSWDVRTVTEALTLDTLPVSKFGIKRVARDIDDPVRALIGEHFGYRGQILQALKQAA